MPARLRRLQAKLRSILPQVDNTVTSQFGWFFSLLINRATAQYASTCDFPTCRDQCKIRIPARSSQKIVS